MQNATSEIHPIQTQTGGRIIMVDSQPALRFTKMLSNGPFGLKS